MTKCLMLGLCYLHSLTPILLACIQEHNFSICCHISVPFLNFHIKFWAMIRRDQEERVRSIGKGHNRARLCSHTGKAEVYSKPFTISALKGCGWSAHHDHFTWGENPVLIIQEAEWALGLVWSDREHLASTEFQSPDCLAHSESLSLTMLHWLSRKEYILF